MWTNDEWMWFGVGVAAVVLGTVLLLLSKFVMDWLTPFKLTDQLAKVDNPAVGLATSGYMAGVVIIYLGAVIGDDYAAPPPAGWAFAQLGIDFGYALGGVVLLNLSRVIVDRLVLYQFSMRKEIIDDRNVGAGAVEAGALVAGAMVIAGAINGYGSFLTAVVFYVLGQAVLVVFGLFYRWMVGYDLHAQIEKDNAAAGVAFGMSMAAIGVILLKATSGSFYGWTYNLTAFVIYAVVGFLTLLILRKLLDMVMLPGVTLEQEIVTDRSLNAAWLEGTAALGVASLIFFML